MPGPDHYTSGTRAALYALSEHTRYLPDCDVPVVRFVGDEPVTNVEIAPIRGAVLGARRYDAAMTDEERRAFVNLLQLCIPHHTTVDRLHPNEFFDLYRDIGSPALFLAARNPGVIDAVVASHSTRLRPAGAAIVLPGTPYSELPARLRVGTRTTFGAEGRFCYVRLDRLQTSPVPFLNSDQE